MSSYDRVSCGSANAIEPRSGREEVDVQKKKATAHAVAPHTASCEIFSKIIVWLEIVKLIMRLFWRAYENFIIPLFIVWVALWGYIPRRVQRWDNDMWCMGE